MVPNISSDEIRKMKEYLEAHPIDPRWDGVDDIFNPEIPFDVFKSIVIKQIFQMRDEWND